MHEQPNGSHRAYHKTPTPGIYWRGRSTKDRYYVVRFKDAEGKRREARATTMAEARDLLSQLRSEVKAGKYRKVTPVTFKEYADRWALRSRGGSGRPIREQTREEYARQLGRATAFFAGQTGRRPLASIQAQDVEAYIDDLFATPFKRATVRRYLVPLKSMFNAAVIEGKMIANPATGIPVIPNDPELLRIMEEDENEEGEAKALTMDELSALIRAMPASHQMLVKVLAQTGLRIGEALGLRWQDIDYDAGVLRVHQSVRGGVVGKPKSKRSRREIPLSQVLRLELRTHHMASPFKGQDDLLFPSDTGEPVHASNLYRWFKPAAKAAGVQWAAFHTLRHTAASRWIQVGNVPAVQVSALLGHADPAFTMRVYCHVLPTDKPGGDALAAAVGL